MPVKVRALFTLAGLSLFTACGMIVNAEVWTQWWFWTGVATAVTATFVETFMTKPQDSIVNSCAAAAAYYSATRSPVDDLWSLYLIVVIAVFVAGTLSALLRSDSFVKSALYQLSIRFGRVTTLGCIALGLEVAAMVVRRAPGAVALGVGTVILAATLSIDWSTLWFRFARRSGQSAQVVDSQSPSLLVIEGISPEIRRGSPVVISGRESTVDGDVVAVLPGKKAARALVSLNGECRDLLDASTGYVSISLAEEDNRTVGIAAAGSTPDAVVFDEARPLPIGQPLTIETAEGLTLYQVSQSRLTDVHWSGSKTLVSRVTAQNLGRNSGGYLRVRPVLPMPHAAIRVPSGDLASTLPDGFCRIGTVKDTAYQVGVVTDAVVSGHIAVVGMSGMGKTSFVAGLCEKLGGEKFVLALDTTGEYQQRLRFPKWDREELTGVGHFVHEPQGEQPYQASELVKRLMLRGREEYDNGGVVSRVLCLEEAHTFVPEWNFCAKNQVDSVNYTARMVMQARKYGLAFIVVTQRTAVLSKSVLSQCESYAVFRTVDDTSLTYLETVGGPMVRSIAPSLQRFEMLCIGPAFNSDSPVIISVDAPKP